MENKKQKKLLLAVDGSDYALNAIKYISTLTPFHKMKVVLFNVFSPVPESYLDLEKDPQFTRAARGVLAWEMQRKKEIQEYMRQARQTLMRSGFSPDAVSVKIQDRKKGIARDILQEALAPVTMACHHQERVAQHHRGRVAPFGALVFPC